MAVKKAKVDPKAAAKVKKVKVTGFAPLKFKDHTITQKSSGRFEVRNAKNKNVNGKDKEALLLDAKVLKGSFKKAVAAPTEAPAT